MNEAPVLRFFVTLRSPYSYLSVNRVRKLVQSSGLALEFRPVYPLAIRNPEFFKKGNPMLLSYLRKDAERVAEMENIPFSWPNPDPIQQDLTTSEISQVQPYIHKITRLCAAACEFQKGFEFYSEASRLIFGGVQNWDSDTHLENAANKAGLVFEQLVERVTTEPVRFDEILKNNEAKLLDTGHWGTPLLSVSGETFFGQDRLEMCAWYLRKLGYAARLI